jgi:Gnt-I system low-affinity gluconate transporter
MIIDYTLIISVLAGIAVLLYLILYFKIPAFIALLTASVVSGLLAGMPPSKVTDMIQEGMGSTLGFVAIVVGLGAIFGAILEHSGGAAAIAEFLIKKMGVDKAPLVMVISGFIIAIPVFFDVAFIILIPVIYALQRQTKKTLLLYAIPLLAALAIAHAFVPPTPGPIAVSKIIGADLGSVILMGIIVGFPTALIGGLLFGKYIAKKIYVAAPEITVIEQTNTNLPPVAVIFIIIITPIILIICNTIINSIFVPVQDGGHILASFCVAFFALIGHPFTALIIANALAWYFLGIKCNFTKDQLLSITTKSLEPAGTIILLTGAGGAFKQVLVDTGIGKMLAEIMADLGFPILLFAFSSAVIIRILQGSATVAMITSAGLVAPLISTQSSSRLGLAAVVIAIASGATITSHVNDSGFWLVKQYLGLSEKQTFKSWTVLTTILAVTSFIIVCILNIFIARI